MAEEILVNVTPMETRVAVLENGDTRDIYIERSRHRSKVGNIYVGKVVRVLPGMQAAFVDIGAERTGFIHVSDIVGPDRGAREDNSRTPVNITDHLHDGKKIIVQVTKDPQGAKGARLTTQLSLATRNLVLLPQTEHMGVSQLITQALERNRLLQVLSQARIDAGLRDGGFILRTAAEGIGPAEVVADVRYLKRLWEAVAQRGKVAAKAGLLYEDLPLHLRMVRDLARPSVGRVVIDSRECFAALREYCDDYVPEISGLLECYSGERPLFDVHGVEDAIQRALERRVELPSGGYLVIDQTEAMTTIDVNTGVYVGKRDQAETILKTNLEAAAALARQLRVRNLGGIIIVDFIDMADMEHRRQVQRTLEELVRCDPVRTRISGVSELGLVEMTRERSRDSLQRALCEDCPVCHGRGLVKTVETVCYDIFRGILREARTQDKTALMVLAAQSVVDRLLDEESAHLADLETFIGKPISVRAEPDYTREYFDIILL